MRRSAGERLETFMAMVGLFLMVVGFLGALLLMFVGIFVELFRGDVVLSGQNLLLLLGFVFGGMALAGMSIFMIQFVMSKLRLRRPPPADSE